MRIKNTLYRRKKGMSSILGTLIFIGILFSAIIPMFLVMKQADNLYTQRVHEVEYEDQDRKEETMTVYAYPVSEISDTIKVKVENHGVVPVSIVRVWINDNYYSISSDIRSLDSDVLGPFTIDLVEEMSYAVTVTTERGNSVASSTGELYYENGGWFTPELGISINIEVFILGRYRITVENTTWTYGPVDLGYVLGDIVHLVSVDSTGNYQITVEKYSWGKWKAVSGSPLIITITYPNGPPIVVVNFKG